MSSLPKVQQFFYFYILVKFLIFYLGGFSGWPITLQPVYHFDFFFVICYIDKENVSLSHKNLCRKLRIYFLLLCIWHFIDAWDLIGPLFFPRSNMKAWI